MSVASLKVALAAAVMLAPVAEASAAGAAAYVYRGAGCTGKARMAPFTALLGRKPQGVIEFAENSDWQHMLDSIGWAAGCWAGTPMAQSVPMLMSTGTLAEGARGDYDAQFVALGKLLVAKRQPNAMLRIGWEFNGNWYRWSAANDPENFKIYFRRIVAALRSVPGQSFRIIWNPAIGQQAIGADLAYPGDDVVNYIALDVYNQSWWPQDVDPQVRWNRIVQQPYGLDWLKTFAAKHRKRIMIPEWGTGTRPDGHGWGDDPLFVSNMAAWFTANNVLMHGYWDYQAPDFDGELSDGGQPNAAAAFKSAFALPKP